MGLDVYLEGKIMCPYCEETFELPDECAVCCLHGDKNEGYGHWRRCNFPDSKGEYVFICCPFCHKRILKLRVTY